jgi:hypothetical protein
MRTQEGLELKRQENGTQNANPSLSMGLQNATATLEVSMNAVSLGLVGALNQLL